MHSKKWMLHPHHARKPISRRRQFVGLSILLLMSALVIAYFVLTDEDRLRYYAQRWLHDFTGGQAHIGRIDFDLFHGLHLVDVTLALPEQVDFDPQDDSQEARTVFRSSTLFLQLRPLSLITGRLVVPEVVAVNPEVILVQRLPDGTSNWELMLARRKKDEQRGRQLQLPEIVIRNGRVRQYRLDERGRSGGTVLPIWAEAYPDADESEVYNVKISRLLQSETSDDIEIGDRQGRLRINMRTLAFHCSLPYLSFDQILFGASPELLHWIDILELKGYVRPDTLQFDPQSGATAVLTLRNAGFSLPIDQSERDNPQQRRFVRLSEISGTIEIRERQAHLQLDGKFRDSAIHVSGSMRLGDDPAQAGLQGVGCALYLKVERLMLPRRGQQAGAEELRFVNRWRRLEEFMRKYDPYGPVDLEIWLDKKTGSAERIEMSKATLTSRGASCCYHKFPYRFYDAVGSVDFLADGTMRLNNLVGRHGEGKVVCNGWIGGWPDWFPVELEFVGENITLDEELIRCLPPRDQALCHLFNVRAKFNAEVRLERGSAPVGVRDNPWTVGVDAEFLDGSVCFESFPYPLAGLSGRLVVGENGFTLHRMRAVRGGAAVEVSGHARRAGARLDQLELDLSVDDLPLDEMLAEALPVGSRKLYDQIDPAGTVDLRGRIGAGDDGRIGYDLDLSVSEGAWNIPGTEIRLDRTAARLRLLPEAIHVGRLKGRLGDSVISLIGGFSLTDGGMVCALVGDPLLLTKELRSKLPEQIQSLWDRFAPSGPVKMSAFCRKGTPPLGPVVWPDFSQGRLVLWPIPAAPEWDYDLVIEPSGCAATLATLPYRMEDMGGRIRVAPGRAVVEKLTARHEQSTFELDGAVDWDDAGSVADLRVRARQLVLDEALREAVPWRLRRVWNNVQPRGVVDLDLQQVRFATVEGKMHDLVLQGAVRMNDVAVKLGTQFTGVNGRLVGRFDFEPSAIEADIHLDQAMVGGRRINAVTARLKRKSGGSAILLRDIQGQFYEGSLVGKVELDFSTLRPHYGVSLTVREVSLEQLLNAKRAPDADPIELKGRVEGNVTLTGRMGEPKSRRGGGSVFITQAQLFKMPLLLAILQVIHFSIDDNAFHDAGFRFVFEGNSLVLEEIDLRGRALSMIGAGSVDIPTQSLDLTLLAGSPLRLPRVEVLTELVEGVARELMEVHVEGTLGEPVLRADIVRSLRITLETILNARRTNTTRPE